MVEFELEPERERMVLDLLGIDCEVTVVRGKKRGLDLIYDPVERTAEIRANSFTDFVEAAGKLKVGLEYHPLFAFPAFLREMDHERRMVATKIVKYWSPLLGGWGWKKVLGALPDDTIEELRKELRLELDTMAIRRMMGEEEYDPIRFLRKQVGYAVLGGIFAVRVRAETKEKERLYRRYLETLYAYIEGEPSFEAMKQIGRIFFPSYEIELLGSEDGPVFVLHSMKVNHKT